MGLSRNLSKTLALTSLFFTTDNYDGLIVIISSHGKQKGIYTVDKNIVTVEELTSRVNGRQCPSLRGKPKLFFISACRGRETDPGVPGPVTSDASGHKSPIPRLPTDADFLLCYATTPNHVAHRRHASRAGNGPEMGTWLISSVTQVFEEKMKDQDVMQMLAYVNERVASMSSRHQQVTMKKKPVQMHMKQMPVQMHMLRHRVFLGSKT